VSEEINLDELNFAGLSALRERIDEKVREMRAMGGLALLARFAEEAVELGLTIEEIVQAGGKRRGRPKRKRRLETARAGGSRWGPRHMLRSSKKEKCHEWRTSIA
jgi:hypothetical protein